MNKSDSNDNNVWFVQQEIEIVRLIAFKVKLNFIDVCAVCGCWQARYPIKEIAYWSLHFTVKMQSSLNCLWLFMKSPGKCLLFLFVPIHKHTLWTLMNKAKKKSSRRGDYRFSITFDIFMRHKKWCSKEVHGFFPPFTFAFVRVSTRKSTFIFCQTTQIIRQFVNNTFQLFMFQFGPLGASTMEPTYWMAFYGLESRPEAGEKEFENFCSTKDWFCLKSFISGEVLFEVESWAFKLL